MADISTSCQYTTIAPNAGMVMIQVVTPATADTSDTILITLASYGIKTLWGIYGAVHTTANSVIVAEAPTTSVSAGVLTITTGGSSQTDKIRSYLIWGN